MDLHKLAIDAMLWLRVGFQLALLVTLVRRGWILKFWGFSAYLAAEVASAAISWFLLQGGSENYSAYFLFYWISYGVTLILRGIVIREVLLGVFARHERLKSVSSTLWTWGVLGLLLAGLVAVRFLPGSEYTQLINTLFIGARLVNGIQLGLMLVLFGMAASLALPWRNLYFGIAFGFGLYAAGSLAGFTLHTVGASVSSDALTWVEVTGYLVAVAVWTGFLFVREPVEVEELPQDFALEHWNQELGRILNK